MKYVFSALLSICTTVSANNAVIEPILQPIPGNDTQGLPSFLMSKYEITVAQFRQFVSDTGYQVPKNCMAFTEALWPDPEKPGRWDLPALIENPYRPVVCTGVQGAIDYAKWLSEKTGKSYRLPSAQQWRHAALAGKSGRMAFADDFQQSEICDYENTEDIANIAGMKKHHQVRYKRSAQCNDGAVYHTVVGMYRPNQYGLYDMVGNVREITRTCHTFNKSEPAQCEQYVVVGEAWHWQPRGVMTPDWMDTDFQGGIEGFRLVLESDKVEPLSVATQDFIEKLKSAQYVQQQVHAQMQTIPASPKGLSAKAIDNSRVELNWLTVPGDEVRYAVYRALSNPSSNEATRFTKVVDKLTQATFIDSTLPEKIFARYQVFSYNSVGEGLGSEIVTFGKAKHFSSNERIEVEHFFTGLYYWVSKREKATIVGFSDNPDHFPTGVKPHKPAWIRLGFKSEQARRAELTFRAVSEQEASFELWQGMHLVGRYDIPAGDKFVIQKGMADLIKSNAPLEIRMDKPQWFELDWLEFK
ncbi:formylglycine-generating enzyme family protein [Pseudoalteromonas sp. JBTF-M23]|uniref:Formylglycine-generating enzyme family protein n=1 Tax=Pseudoalteromonas caenipelagi TaxID=2726988 RepID=A0A849VGW8_9GAMM|nr:SUMF1/EgtB/PvdO family nonheme iron enzyme [Pseudoalteromonas caenipelagi]NOU52515.1 formylglycine-generating enzyme family protein [Pseudoalteromonas caenipelagi]